MGGTCPAPQLAAATHATAAVQVEYSEVLPSARQGVPSSRPSSSNSHGSSAPQAPFPQHLKSDGPMFDGHMGSPYPLKSVHDPRAPRSQEHPGPQQLSPGRQHGMAFGNITDFVAAHNYDPGSGMFGTSSGGVCHDSTVAHENCCGYSPVCSAVCSALPSCAAVA